MANPLKNTATVLAAFALAATAILSPMPVQAEGFFDDLKAGVKQGLERRGNQGGMEGAIAGGLNSMSKSVGDKTSELTGVPTAARQIPKYQGLSLNREQLVCYNQINGKPDPKEHPQYYRDFVQARVKGARDTTPFRTNERAFATPGRGGATDGTALAAELANNLLSNCAQEVAKGNMHPVGAPNYTSDGPDRLVHVSAHNKCSGEPADDWNETRDRMVMPRGMGELDKYGPYPIMRCNQTTGLYGPITSNDPQSPWNPAGSFIPKSKELAAAENIKVQKELAKMMAEYEEDRLDPTARVRRGTSSYDPAGTLNDPMRKRATYGGKAFTP